MTRLPPVLGRLSRNERALREAELRMQSWAKIERRKGEREKRAELSADIAIIKATHGFAELTLGERRAIYARIPGARL